LIARIFQTYKYKLPTYTTIAKEKKLMEQEIADEVLEADQKAFHFKVDLMKYVADYENAKNTVQSHNVEPLLFGKMGRPYLFHPSNYPNLIKRLEEVMDVIGFGPVMVASMVGLVLKEISNNAENESVFEPSVEWCRWFLRTQMGLVKRRVTSHAYTVEEKDKQQHLHKLNLDHLAKMIADHGLTPEFIFCSDELGVHLQPEEVERWVKKGSKVVASSLSLDKRQFTANIIANASGDLVAHHQIFGGKTEACLPDVNIRSKYEEAGYIFSHSENHWNNQSLKLVELSRIHSWKVKNYLT
jgi:hypothetical protein